MPYEEYAEFGYQISGCEPVNVEEMRYGDGDLTTVTSITGAKYEQKKAYFSRMSRKGTFQNILEICVSVMMA